ncbi:MAG: hypothetical protein IJP92_13270 [Lachnospiraceae bacterium]|nr:hypothetical protein [Lachnospiraceae bacterium]
MANPTLVKSFYTQEEKKNVRVIDNNARLAERIAAAREEEQRRQQMTPEYDQPYEDYGDEFVEGLNAEQLEQLTGEPGEYGMEPEGEAIYEGEEGGAYESVEGEEAPPPPPRPAQNIAALTNEQIAKAQEEAAQIVQDAQEQAAQIMAQAQEEAQQIRDAAHQEGYDAGFAEGRTQGKEEAAAEMEAEHKQRLRDLDNEYQAMVDKLEPEMVDTLTRIYEHVFDVNLRGEKKIILHLLQTTLSRIEPGDDFIIHVSSADYDHMEDEKERLREYIINPNATLELIEDPLLNENECMIETEGGIFDCSLGTELSELTRKLKLLAFDRRRN